MLLLIIVSLFIVDGVFSTKPDCEVENKAISRDGLSCYECGKSTLHIADAQLKPTDRKPAIETDFPWHASLFRNKTEGWSLTCGGTLVTPLVVITAMSCITWNDKKLNYTTEEFRVVFGKTNVLWNVTSPSETRRQVKEIHLHPEYKGKPSNFANDIALIILDSAVTSTPACLDHGLKVALSQMGFISGFGYPLVCTKDCFMSDKLMYSITKMMTFDECSNTMQAKSNAPTDKLTSDKLCIGNGTISPIQKGNGGDGVTIVYKGLYYLVGVASSMIYRYDNGELTYMYGNAVNLRHHMEWIVANIPEDH